LAQPAHDHVEHRVAARMPHVAIVVHGHAAHVHAHPSCLDRSERFLFTRVGVVDGQFAHRSSASSAARASRARMLCLPSSSQMRAISGPCVSPVKAARNGMNKSLPLRPVLAPTDFEKALKSSAPSTRSAATRKKAAPALWM